MCVGSDFIQGRNLFRRGDPAGDRDLGVTRRLDVTPNCGQVDAGQATLALDKGDQESADVVAQGCDALEYRGAGLTGPAVVEDLAVGLCSVWFVVEDGSGSGGYPPPPVSPHGFLRPGLKLLRLPRVLRRESPELCVRKFVHLRLARR